MAIYVCSNIHGQYELYKEMLNTINFNQDDQLFILGDMIDRGSDGIDILFDVMKHPNVTCLLGNHELMMWEHLNQTLEQRIWRDKRSRIWLSSFNGGKVTKKAYKKLTIQEQKLIDDYIRSLYLQYELKIDNKTILLSHSDFVQSEGTVRWKERSQNEVFDIVWNSPWRFWHWVSEEKYKDDNRLHIIGHVPVQYVLLEDRMHETKPYQAYEWLENNIINIDLGCGLIGQLDKLFPCLCVMNLTEYLVGNKTNAFSYIFPKGDDVNGR